MKLALQIMSWVAVAIGILTIIGGLTDLSTDPNSAYYSLLGGLLFVAQGVIALMYIHAND